MAVRILLVVATLMSAAPAQLAPARSAPLFQFATDDFWLNLHHYLYVLGRAHNGAVDATQPAVASAPDDERQGLAALTDAERGAWNEAVTAYANGVSREASFLQPPLAPMSVALAGAGDGAVFPVAAFDPGARAALERAAPLYRKAWWPRHRALNQQYLRDLQQTIDRDGPAIVAFLTRAYQVEWPRRPYPAHLVAYSSWQGAFSITDSVLILSTNSNPTNDRWYPLESVFHEGMHQWDIDLLYERRGGPPSTPGARADGGRVEYLAASALRRATAGAASQERCAGNLAAVPGWTRDPR